MNTDLADALRKDEMERCWWACWDDGRARRCENKATPTGFCAAHDGQPRLKLYGEPDLPLVGKQDGAR